MSGVIYIIGDECLSRADFALIQSCTIDIALWLLVARESEFGVIGRKMPVLHGRVALRSNEAMSSSISFTTETWNHEKA
jgi:hypothetical protein